MPEVRSVNGGASGSSRHIAEAVPALSGRLNAKAHDGRVDLSRLARRGIHADSVRSTTALQDTPTMTSGLRLAPSPGR